MECKCHICPRYLNISSSEWFGYKKDFVNVCIECGGMGGNVGNMNHLRDCKYYNCYHEGYRIKYKNNDTGLTEYSNAICGWATWSYDQPTRIIRDYHIRCMETRKDEIELARRKMARNVMFKVCAIIEIKTGKKINPYVIFKGFDSEAYIKKWNNILSNSYIEKCSITR